MYQPDALLYDAPRTRHSHFLPLLPAIAGTAAKSIERRATVDIFLLPPADDVSRVTLNGVTRPARAKLLPCRKMMPLMYATAFRDATL